MRVMITGASGFIGSHIVEKLIQRGVKVRIYDLIYPEFIDELPPEKRSMIQYQAGSLLEQDRLRLATSNMDAVYHLAAVADVNDVERDPAYTNTVNIRGMLNVLEACRINPGKPRLIFASTVWIYQDTPQPEGGLLTEDAPIAHPSHYYTATKLAGEAFLVAYSKLYETQHTILRFGIPYGPRARGATVISLFVRKALNGEALTIAGDGSQYRKFIYVDDLAEGCVLALKPEAKNRIYNLEGDEITTIKQVAEGIKEILGDVTITRIEGRKGDFSGKNISNERAKSELGWSPSTTFKEGLRKYIDWVRSQPEETPVTLF